MLAAGAEAAAAAAAAHDEATKARGTWVSAGASVDKKDAVAHASRAREPASAGGAPQPPAPPAASPPAVSQQCVIVRGAVQFEPGDAEIEAEVARIIDRDQMKRDGGRGLLSREDLLKALRKLGRARGVGDALADQWEQRDLRVGAAVLAALRKLQADLRVASLEARARGARLSEVLDAVLEQLRDAHEGMLDAGNAIQETAAAPPQKSSPPFRRSFAFAPRGMRSVQSCARCLCGSARLGTCCALHAEQRCVVR